MANATSFAAVVLAALAALVMALVVVLLLPTAIAMPIGHRHMLGQPAAASPVSTTTVPGRA